MHEGCSGSTLLVNDWWVEWRYERSNVLVLFYEPASVECMLQTVTTQTCASMWERLRGTAVLESRVTGSCTLHSSTGLELLILFRKTFIRKASKELENAEEECNDTAVCYNVFGWTWFTATRSLDVSAEFQMFSMCLCALPPSPFLKHASRWIITSKIASRFKWMFEWVCECFVWCPAMHRLPIRGTMRLVQY